MNISLWRFHALKLVLLLNGRAAQDSMLLALGQENVFQGTCKRTFSLDHCLSESLPARDVCLENSLCVQRLLQDESSFREDASVVIFHWHYDHLAILPRTTRTPAQY